MKTIKRSKLGIIALLLVFYRVSLAAFEDMPAGARICGIAEAAAAFRCYENLFYNPAGFWLDSGVQAGAFTGKLYGLDDLRHNSLIGAFHVQRLTIGVGAQTFGNKNYLESTACIGVCTQVSRAFFAGAAIRYARLAITGYGQAGTFLADLGALVKISPQLSWGWAARNITCSTIGQCREKLPQSIVTGIQLQPVNAVKLNMDIYKDIRFPVEFRSGVEIELVPGFPVRSGIATAPSRFTAGFSLRLQHVNIDYALNTHPYLKITHFFTLVFSIGH